MQPAAKESAPAAETCVVCQKRKQAVGSAARFARETIRVDFTQYPAWGSAPAEDSRNSGCFLRLAAQLSPEVEHRSLGVLEMLEYHHAGDLYYPRGGGKGPQQPGQISPTASGGD